MIEVARAQTGVESPEVIASGQAFLESPRWHNGRLYVSDFYTHEVLVLTDTGLEPICVVPGQPSGLGWDRDGHLLVVSMLDHRLCRLEGDTLVQVAELFELAGGPCNDLLVDPEGGAYVGSFYDEIESDGALRTTSIVRVDPDGAISTAAAGLICPNGMALTPDGRTLLVAETLLGRITAFERAADGSLGERRAWAEFTTSAPSSIPSRIIASDLLLPDGICLDAEGALWIADAGGSGAVRAVQGGEILEKVVIEDMTVYACALGGEDGRTLYLCAAPPLFTTDHGTHGHASLLAMKVDVPGAKHPDVPIGKESHAGQRR